jgi:hypothetical protein
MVDYPIIATVFGNRFRYDQNISGEDHLDAEIHLQLHNYPDLKQLQ